MLSSLRKGLSWEKNRFIVQRVKFELAQYKVSASRRTEKGKRVGRRIPKAQHKTKTLHAIFRKRWILPCHSHSILAITCNCSNPRKKAPANIKTHCRNRASLARIPRTTPLYPTPNLLSRTHQPCEIMFPCCTLSLLTQSAPPPPPPAPPHSRPLSSPPPPPQSTSPPQTHCYSTLHSHCCSQLNP